MSRCSGACQIVRPVGILHRCRGPLFCRASPPFLRHLETSLMTRLSLSSLGATVLLASVAGAQISVQGTANAPAGAKTTTAKSEPAKPTIEQFMSPASPLEVTSAKKTDRIAWMAYEKGMRNVYTAAAPNFTPVRLTSFMKDDGVDLTGVKLSDDGSVVAFIRGSATNRDGWVANPSHDPNGPDRAIWAVSTSGSGVAHRVADGANFELSPDGRYVLYADRKSVV